MQHLLTAIVHEPIPVEQLLYANANINMAYELGNIIDPKVRNVPFAATCPELN
jgi:hypothetical protein